MRKILAPVLLMFTATALLTGCKKDAAIVKAEASTIVFLTTCRKCEYRHEHDSSQRYIFSYTFLNIVHKTSFCRLSKSAAFNIALIFPFLGNIHYLSNLVK